MSMPVASSNPTGDFFSHQYFPTDFTIFLDGAELVFKAKSTTGEYHDEMNSTNFFQ